MAKLDFMRLERIENRTDRRHPGRRLAKDWYKEVLRNDINDWVWSTEIDKPSTESLRDIKDDAYQSDDVLPEIELWREKRKLSWIENFWSSEWEHGHRITGTFYQHPDDPSEPSETETAQMYGYMLASIPPEVFAWARFHKKVWSRSYEKRYMKHRDIMDVVVEYASDDFLRIECRAQYWLGKLGPVKPEDIPLPTWASEAKQFGHGTTEKTYPENEFSNHYANRTIKAYKKLFDVWNMIEKVIEADRQKQSQMIGDI